MSRYFEFKDEKSNKFWEISCTDNSMTVHYGKIGATGQTKIKDFESSSVAATEEQKAITKKLKEGYIEIKK